MIQPVKRVLTNWRNVQHVEQGELKKFYINSMLYGKARFEFAGYGTVLFYRKPGPAQVYLEGSYSHEQIYISSAHIDYNTNVRYIRIYGQNYSGKEKLLLSYSHP